METVSVQRVQVFSWSATLIGFMGICSGIQVNSFEWSCVAIILWGFTTRCIDRTWMPGVAGELIMHNGSVWNRVERNCYIVRSSLPKGCTFFRIKKNAVGTLATDLFVRADFGEGYIVQLAIIITATMGTSPKEIGEYYQYFIQGEQSEDDYIVRKLKYLQQREENGVGLLSTAYRYDVGKSDWVRSFQRALQNHLDEEFALVGLRVDEIKVAYGNHARSLFIQGGKVL